MDIKDTAVLIQRMRDEAEQCDVYGITKPAALLRESADALQQAAADNTRPTAAPGQCPMCGEYSMSARAMQGLYGHSEGQA